jgi:NRPS condensation-like uncharacterized protein
MGSPSRGKQINVYGLDTASRNKFKALCKGRGYSMNDVILEMLEFILENPDNLKNFFQGRYGRTEKTDA